MNDEIDAPILLALYIVVICVLVIFIVILIVYATNTIVSSMPDLASMPSTHCQYVLKAKVWLFDTRLFCSMNSSRAWCSNGGFHIPFITNTSYLSWPMCNASQMTIINQPNSIISISN